MTLPRVLIEQVPDVHEVLRRHDAGVPGYRIGDLYLLNVLLLHLGWQGGTIYAALAVARSL